jgi:hypothetical protein
MPLWKLWPVAHPDDSRWQDHAIWKEVIVRADNAALARQLAARLEWDPDEPPSGNESLPFQSAFQDEKLYWVTQLSPEEAAALGGDAGEQGVIRAVPFAEVERERAAERRY